MPVYLAEEVSGTLKPTTLLEERGLKMRSVPMSRLDPSAFPSVLQPVYRTYIQNISAFMVRRNMHHRTQLIANRRPQWKIVPSVSPMSHIP
jgi:hypothetical protein